MNIAWVTDRRRLFSLPPLEIEVSDTFAKALKAAGKSMRGLLRAARASQDIGVPCGHITDATYKAFVEIGRRGGECGRRIAKALRTGHVDKDGYLVVEGVDDK